MQNIHNRKEKGIKMFHYKKNQLKTKTAVMEEMRDGNTIKGIVVTKNSKMAEVPPYQ